tara:strand:- start:234 stop:611 length:378 start_codon:yes stop_codon:yes gene_type:complete
MNKNMIALAKDNTIRVSPLKLNNIVRLIVNQKVDKAINQLKFSQKRISTSVLKVLNSAIANAENNNQMDIDYLYVKEAYVGKGLSMKRFRPRAKGRASRIIKPFSRLTIILEEKRKVNKKETKQK